MLSEVEVKKMYEIACKEKDDAEEKMLAVRKTGSEIEIVKAEMIYSMAGDRVRILRGVLNGN